MATVRITSTFSHLSTRPGRVGKDDVTVQYTVDNMGPYAEVFSEEDFTIEKAEQRIRELVRKTSPAVNRTFSV